MTQTVEQPKCTRIEVGHSQTSRKQWKNSPMSNSAERTTEMKSTKMSTIHNVPWVQREKNHLSAMLSTNLQIDRHFSRSCLASKFDWYLKKSLQMNWKI